jgi:hypothetical protein
MALLETLRRCLSAPLSLNRELWRLNAAHGPSSARSRNPSRNTLPPTTGTTKTIPGCTFCPIFELFLSAEFCRFVTAAPVRERQARAQQCGRGSNALDHRIRSSISKPAQMWQEQRAYKADKMASSGAIATTALHFQGSKPPIANDACLSERQVHQQPQPPLTNSNYQSASKGTLSKWSDFSEQKQQPQKQQQRLHTSSMWGAFVDSSVASLNPEPLCIRDEDDNGFTTCFD